MSVVHLGHLDHDLLTYIRVFEARTMKFQPPIEFLGPVSMVDLVDLDRDLLT